MALTTWFNPGRKGLLFSYNQPKFKRNFKLANGHGGQRSNAGRPTNEFWEKVDALKKTKPPEKILEFYWSVANGEAMEQVVTDAGESISTPAAIRDRLKAGELYLDRVIGKVPQVTELTGQDGSDFSAIPTAALAEIVEALSRATVGSASAGTRKEAGQ